VCVGSCRRPSPSSNSFNFISTSSRREFVLAGHQSDTALQRLPGIVRSPQITRDRGADPVRSRRKLYSAGRRRESSAQPRRPASWVNCTPAAVLLCVRSVRQTTATGTFLANRLRLRPTGHGTRR